MNTFIVTFVALTLFIFLMALGVLMGRKPLQGSCGGLGKLMGKTCEFCNKRGECTKNTSETS